MKKTISILLTLCMIVGLMPAAMAAKKATFTDVPEDMWCFDYVEYVAEEGYFKGTTTTTFEPNAPMTRQQFVVVLSRMVNAKVNNNQSPFSDVPAGSYSAGAIAWASRHGIAQGYEDGTFRPTEPITRQQMTAFMNRFMTYYAKNYGVRYISKNAKITFKDASEIAAYAKDTVDYCVKYGLILGYEDGTFRPTANATRAHVAAIIQRLDKITRKSSGGGGTPEPTYTITFDGPGKENVTPNPQNLSVGSRLPVLQHADIDGNGVIDLFNGWTLVGDANPNVYTTLPSVTGPATMVSNWTKQFTVTYQDADGVQLGGAHTQVTYVENSKIKIAAPLQPADPDKQEFAGWLEIAGANVTAGTTNKVWTAGTVDAFEITENTVLKATWNEKNDLLKTAFVGENGDGGVVGYINDNIYSRYENAQGVVENAQGIVQDIVDIVGSDSLVVDEVDYDFTGTKREIYVNASAELMDDTIKSLVRRAVDYAVDLVQSTEPAADELTADYETVKTTVIDVVEALGLTWTGKDIEALAQQIYDQGADAADDIWDFFQSAEDGYFFETADVIVAGETVFSITSATKSTSLGAKASAKALAVAIAQELYADLKTETTPDNVVDLTTSVTMSFNNVAKNRDDQEYPTEYTMIANMTFTSDVVSYYYENDTHNFIVTISKDWQTAYDAAVQTVADEALAAMEATLSEKMDGMLDGYLSGSSMDSMIEQLVKFGIYANEDEANAAIAAVAESAAAAWIAENLGTEATPAGADYYLPYDFFWLQNGQIEVSGDEYILTIDGADTERKLFNNDVLLDTIEAWADDMIANADIQGIMDDTMNDLLDDQTKAQYQADVVENAKNNAYMGTIDVVLQLHNLTQSMFGYASLDALFQEEPEVVIAVLDDVLSEEYPDRSQEILVQDLLIEIINAEVDTVFQGVMATMNDPMITDLINGSAEVEAYVKDLAMVEMGFETSYAPSTEETDAALTDIETYLNDYIEDKINSTVDPDAIADMIDDQIVSIVSSYSKYLQFLPYLQSVNTFEELASAKVSNLTTALASDELQTLIAKAEISDENMTKALNALAKAIEKLPIDASIEINGVKISETELAAVKAAAEAHDLALVCDELAALLSGLNGLSLDSINKLPMTVTYGDRSENASLTVVIEPQV